MSIRDDDPLGLDPGIPSTGQELRHLPPVTADPLITEARGLAEAAAGGYILRGSEPAELGEWALCLADALVVERQRTAEDARKVEAYDAARYKVKREGLSRAEYVLRAEAAEAALVVERQSRQDAETRADKLESALRSAEDLLDLTEVDPFAYIDEAKAVIDRAIAEIVMERVTERPPPVPRKPAIPTFWAAGSGDTETTP